MHIHRYKTKHTIGTLEYVRINAGLVTCGSPDIRCCKNEIKCSTHLLTLLQFTLHNVIL